MGEMKPTPGPWKVSQNVSRHVVGPTGGVIASAELSCKQEISEANARLIAAAPELLEAAKLVLEWYEAEDNHSGTDFYQRMQMCRDSEDAIRAAIAKATGEQT